MLARFGPPLTVLLLAGPVLAGLAGTLLPAFGYLPALGGMSLTLDPFRELAGQPGLWRAVLTSLGSGLAATAISLLAVMLFVAAWAGTRTFARVQHLISPLLSVPHAAAAFGLAFLIAPSGMIARLISPAITGWQRPPDLLIVQDPMAISLVVGLVVKEIPFLLLMVLAALTQAQVEPTRRLTASLGYGRVAGFLYGAWPTIYRQVRLAVFAVLAFSTSVVDVAAILGPTRPPTLAVMLVGWMNDPDISMRFMASAGAVLQLAVTATALGIWLGLERLAGRARRALAGRGLRFRRDGLVVSGALAVMTVSALTVFAGLVTLGIWSLAGLWQFPEALPRSFTMRSWMDAAPRIAQPMTTTVLVGLTATAIAATLAVLCLLREDRVGRGRIPGAAVLVYLPLIVPQASFLFGLQLVFLLSGIGASLPALVFAHLVFVMPYVFLSMSDPWRAFDRRHEAVAYGLGRSRLATLWQVRMPMLLRPLLAAAAVGFAVSVGQYLPTVLIGAGRLTTVTSEAVALASGGNRRVIGVYAFLQMTLPFIAFAVATLAPALLFRRFTAMRS